LSAAFRSLIVLANSAMNMIIPKIANAPPMFASVTPRRRITWTTPTIPIAVSAKPHIQSTVLTCAMSGSSTIARR
jgi:hypothetical protein